MSFPQIVGSQLSSRATNAVDDVVDLPASVAAGDLLIIFHFTDSAALSATVPGSWAEIKDAATAGAGVGSRILVAWLKATGGETTVTVTKLVTERFSSIAIRISAASWDGVTAPEISTGATGTSANPDPDSLNPAGWGTEDTLWIAVMAFDDSAGTGTVDAYPYTANNLKAPGVSSGASGAICSTESAVASIDPGTFTINPSDEWWAGTVAVRPATTGFTLTMGQGSYALTGQAVTLKAARMLTANQGGYTLSGQALLLNHGFILSLAQGSYTLTGQATGLLAARALALAQGNYTLTGQVVSLLAARLLTATQGSYTYTGQSVTLTFGAAGAFTLMMGQGSYTLTGQAISLLAARLLTVGQGSYTLTGQAALLVAARLLAANQGSYSLTGQMLGLTAGRLLTISQGAYNLTGQSMPLVATRLLTMAQGNYAYTGQSVILTASAVILLAQAARIYSGSATATIKS